MLVGADRCGKWPRPQRQVVVPDHPREVRTQTQPLGTLAARPDKRLRGSMTHVAITNV